MHGRIRKISNDQPNSGRQRNVDNKVGQPRSQPKGGRGRGERKEESAAGFLGQEEEDEGARREEEEFEGEAGEDY